MLTAVIRPGLSASIRGPACLHQQSVNSGRRGRTVSCDRQLLQLLVLLGLLQGGDVGVGGFPEAEEVLVGSACARGIGQITRNGARGALQISNPAMEAG
jgi:hypothetical protein